MKSVRIFFKKTGRLKFVSHLDMNRFMTRVLRKTEIPLWYTEGFNKHLYLNFALPLTLGFESDYEAMDIKITDDDYPLSSVMEEINRVTPDYLSVFSVSEPVSKCSEIAFAKFSVRFFETDIKDKLLEFFSLKEIICKKRTKKGDIVSIDVAGKIADTNVTFDTDTVLNLTLPAGNTENINPTIVIDAFSEFCGGNIPYYEIKRSGIFDKKMELFK